MLKAIQGKSALPQDVLSEMLEDTRQKVLDTSERITKLTAELNAGNSKIEEMKAEFNRIVSWSKIFDESADGGQENDLWLHHQKGSRSARATRSRLNSTSMWSSS